MLDDLVDRPLGPYEFRTDPGRVVEFLAATGDDESRWQEVAPPSFVAAGLFAAATPFLAHPDVLAEARSILHGEQTFRWSGAIPLGAVLAVTAHLRRLRRRGDTAFVWLKTDISEGGTLVAESDSMFLLSSAEPERTEESHEPPPLERGESEPPSPIDLPPEGGPLPPLAKSASRMELVRYAAASGDWNPIHWDHDSAVEAGLPGVICHGLLMTAWVLQAAGRTTTGPHPLAEARMRFRAPLRPAVQASIEGQVKAADAAQASLALAVTSTEIEHVAATVIVRSG